MSPPRAVGGRRAQVQASNPRASVFVAANAGSGKTSTLVTRVARLLLAGAAPEAILCVTFTKAGAAEMQTRLFDTLGDWAVMASPKLAEELADIDEAGRDLRKARALFARALETPGGLKIQTIHAFCEKLLRRFPLEAGVSPGFTVLEDAAAREVSAWARDDVAAAVLQAPQSALAAAYDHFAVDLDYRAFTAMFADFEAKRAEIAAYVARCEADAGIEADVWGRCGFDAPADPDAIEQWALKRTRTVRWRRVAETLAGSGKVSEVRLGQGMLGARASDDFADLKALFLTDKNEPREKLVTLSAGKEVRDFLADEQARCVDAAQRAANARLAAESLQALTLATAYAALYDGAKDEAGALDFGDLIGATLELLTKKADAAWVLFKLDNCIEHVLLDEAQDTAPEQWGILKALTDEFFHGLGTAGPTPRTMFAVGDEKQSIFSFQGAAPERLAIETDAFSARIRDAGLAFERVPLLESWRSAPEILSFVDRLFKDPQAYAGLRPAGGPVRALDLQHRPTRTDHGCVELWPLEQGETAETEDDPWAPVDREPPKSANKFLAQRIARAIVDMVDRGDGVLDRGAERPRRCTPGDVMILVRRRGPLFHEIIRALKREDVPVAGADRLKLSEHGVYEDLMALGRFARFPPDDLSLAVLLRSPFCDVGEDGLYDLAYGRERSLWRTLRDRAGERTEWADAARFLGWARAEAERIPPFDFYCSVLGRIDPAGRSMRQRILTRLGAEGEQALEAFVGQVLGAEAAGARDLESLMAWMGGLELDIKREQPEGGGAEVRVMTVHGAKGLEAPIVILPDTTSRATWQGGRLLSLADGAFLWAPRKADDGPVSAAAKVARQDAVEAESSRLLYVALTRARDRLILAGVEPLQPWRQERSWRDFIDRAFARLEETRPFALPGGGEGRRFGPDPVPALALAPAAAAQMALPAWIQGLARPETPAERRASPSRLGDDEPGAAPSPIATVAGLGRYRRGDLIHRLLQVLPDLGAERRAEAAAGLLARERDLTDAQRQEMAAAALAVLGDQRFAAVFGPGSRAEIPVVGEAAGLAISGRVDRLLVEDRRVLVVDFKTNRPAPATIEAADPAYVRQMAIYKAVLAEVFPGKAIEAALIWTDGPSLMPVPEEMMAEALENLT
ncbi:MAG TPA: double-strand break repair helicase AddA [Caulobacteraceae bacterium]